MATDVNSTAVNRAIRALVWPAMKDRGFTCFTSRSAWRDREHLVDVVNFQSFNRYNADVLGCTTFSFAINLSVYLTDVPEDHPLPIRNDRPRPAEYRGHIRRRLWPDRPQFPDSPDIWFVDKQGNNTQQVVAAAAAALTTTADTWFAAFADRRTVLSVLRGEIEPPGEATSLPGAPGSAALNIAIGYVALAIGERATAADYLRRALEQYRSFDEQLAKTGARFGKTTPSHLARTVARLSEEATKAT